MNRHKRAWNAKELILMKNMFDDGSSDDEIGHIIGRTAYAIRKKRLLMGMGRNDKPGRPRGSKNVKIKKPLQTQMQFKEPTKGAKYTRYMKPSTEVSILWGLIKYTKA